MLKERRERAGFTVSKTSSLASLKIVQRRGVELQPGADCFTGSEVKDPEHHTVANKAGEGC